MKINNSGMFFSGKFLAFFIVFAVLFSAEASAFVSPDDAVKFVSEKNHFVKEGEKTAFNPNVLITYKEVPYRVVSILVGDTQVTYVAVSDAKEPVVVAKREDNRKLFETAYVVGKFQEAQESLNKKNQWFFTLSNAKNFKDLARYLGNEKVDLSVVKSEVLNSEIISKINELSSELDAMSTQAEDI